MKLGQENVAKSSRASQKPRRKESRKNPPKDGVGEAINLQCHFQESPQPPARPLAAPSLPPTALNDRPSFQNLPESSRIFRKHFEWPQVVKFISYQALRFQS